jgi:GMP synthase (glutamine-hydrolysing)
MRNTVLAIRHVAFEDLGILSDLLEARGLAFEYLDAGSGKSLSKAVESELLVVLGGPVGAYEEAAYPFLTEELRVLEQRLSAERPTLGICLGAQLLARTLGARVYAGDQKEIGWSELTLSDAGRASCVGALSGAPVLHWHGDTFDLPKDGVLLASSDMYENQAFEWRKCALGLQFHAEVTAQSLEHWYIGHAAELAQARVSVPELRREGLDSAALLERSGRACFLHWFEQVGL